MAEQQYRVVGAKRAHTIVRRAVMAGSLPPVRGFKCVDCGAPATEYDHRDYNKPLDVAPVCRGCNAMRGYGVPLGCDYTHGFGYGYVVSRDSCREATFQVWDFGDCEEAELLKAA